MPDAGPPAERIGRPEHGDRVAVMYAASAAIWFSMAGSVQVRAGAVGLALALVGLTSVNANWRFIDVKYAKGQKLAGEQFVRWNSFSRIGLGHEKGSGIPMIFISTRTPPPGSRPSISTTSPRATGTMLEHEGPGLPYVMRPGAKTLIIGSGGGWDVARALASGSRDITGVEINPIIANTIMRERFPQFSRGIYLRPDVHIFVEDGRSFVRRTTQRFQVIQATLVDTWASQRPGPSRFPKQPLHHRRLSRLPEPPDADDGVVAFTRWGFDPPRESLRLISLALEGLGRWARRSPRTSSWGGSFPGTSRMGRARHRADLAQAVLERGRRARAAGRLSRSHAGGLHPRPDRPPPSEDLLLSPHPIAFESNYPFDITPVTDNRPFFFYTVQPSDIWSSCRQPPTTAPITRSTAPSRCCLAWRASASCDRGDPGAAPVHAGQPPAARPGVPGFLLYFVCIGAGYILVEVALIQKFVLFLGHPTYALTVVIFSLLVSSGLGSYFSRRIIAGSTARFWAVLIGVTVSVIAVAFIAAPLTTALVWLPMPAKATITVLLVAAPAFLMGMPFPTGLARLEQMHHASVRWAWSLNAAASVLGSASAICLGIYLGLRLTIVIGGPVLYRSADGVPVQPRPPGRITVHQYAWAPRSSASTKK